MPTAMRASRRSRRRWRTGSSRPSSASTRSPPRSSATRRRRSATIAAPLKRDGYDVVVRIAPATPTTSRRHRRGRIGQRLHHPSRRLDPDQRPRRRADARRPPRSIATAAQRRDRRAAASTFRSTTCASCIAATGSTATSPTLAARGQLDNVASCNEVELSNGEKLPFTIDRFSPALAQHGTDLALLEIDHKNLPMLTARRLRHRARRRIDLGGRLSGRRQQHRRRHRRLALARQRSRSRPSIPASSPRSSATSRTRRCFSRTSPSTAATRADRP